MSRPALQTVSEPYTTGPLNVIGPNAGTVEFFAASGCERYAELGVYVGDTAKAVAAHLGGRGEIHLFDYEDRVVPLAEELARAGHDNVIAYPNTRRVFDSYNWSLMKLLRTGPRFDYVFIDGAHTWAVDALAFCLVDRLLAPGGYVDFDDYFWTLERSPSMNPQTFPPTSKLYSDEQIAATQVALVVDLLVRTREDYEEVVENRIFRKRGSP